METGKRDHRVPCGRDQYVARVAETDVRLVDVHKHFGDVVAVDGVTLPRVLHEERPQYTSDAMRAKVQGTVLLECVVRVDGSVSDVQIVRSLDPTFGLDQQAMAAARRWRFAPGTRMGEPVPVLITIELTFTLR